MALIFISTGGFFHDILYSSGGNIGTNYNNMASSSNTSSSFGPGGNGGGNPGGGGSTNHYVYTRNGGGPDDIKDAVYNPDATGFPTLAANLRIMAENVNLDRISKGKVASSVSLRDIGVTRDWEFFSYLKEFTTQYRGNDRVVDAFCKNVNTCR